MVKRVKERRSLSYKTKGGEVDNNQGREMKEGYAPSHRAFKRDEVSLTNLPSPPSKERGIKGVRWINNQGEGRVAGLW